MEFLSNIFANKNCSWIKFSSRKYLQDIIHVMFLVTFTLTIIYNQNHIGWQNLSHSSKFGSML
jgi:hypothetical protein